MKDQEFKFQAPKLIDMITYNGLVIFRGLTLAYVIRRLLWVIGFKPNEQQVRKQYPYGCKVRCIRGEWIRIKGWGVLDTKDNVGEVFTISSIEFRPDCTYLYFKEGGGSGLANYVLDSSKNG